MTYDDDFLKAAIFGELDSDEWEEATSDDNVVEFTDSVKVLVRQLQRQLEDYNHGNEHQRDADWRGRTVSIIRKGAELLLVLNGMVKKRNVRHNNVMQANMFAAICEHRRQIKADEDLEPSPADIELWKDRVSGHG